MKTSSLRFSRPCLVLAATLWLAAPLGAQSAGRNDRPDAGPGSRPTIPAADKLTLLGQVATPAEAKPLIEKYHAEQEQLFQERRAMILTLRGKKPAEKLEIMQALVVAQKERRQKNRELGARLEAMLKKDREENSRSKKPTGDGR